LSSRPNSVSVFLFYFIILLFYYLNQTRNKSRGIDPNSATQVVEDDGAFEEKQSTRIDPNAATQVVGDEEEDEDNATTRAKYPRIDPSAATQVVDEDFGDNEEDVKAKYPRIDPSAATQVVDDDFGYSHQEEEEPRNQRRTKGIDHAAATQVVDEDDILSMVDASLEFFGDSDSYLLYPSPLSPPFFLPSLLPSPSSPFLDDNTKKSSAARLFCDFKSTTKRRITGRGRISLAVLCVPLFQTHQAGETTGGRRRGRGGGRKRGWSGKCDV
jgi:hypothetical protein